MIQLSALKPVETVQKTQTVQPVASKQAGAVDQVQFSGAVAPKANPVTIEKWVKDLEKLPRYSMDVAGNWKTADWIKLQLSAMGYQPEEQVFEIEKPYYMAQRDLDGGFYDPSKKQEFKNVMVSVGPKNADRIIIGAHYDAEFGGRGADDNASGVAGLLELAKLLKQNEDKLNVRIDLVSYPLEEFTPAGGLYGSQMHARKIIQESKEQGFKIKGAISLDCIGYYSDEPGSQKYLHPAMKKLKFLKKFKSMAPLFWGEKGNFVFIAGDQYSEGFLNKINKSFNGATDIPTRAAAIGKPDGNVLDKLALVNVYRSDHASYRMNGNVHPGFLAANKKSVERLKEYNFPQEAIDFRLQQSTKEFLEHVMKPGATSDFPVAILSDSANMRYPGYHKTTDSTEFYNLDYNNIAKIVEGLYAFATEEK